MDRTERFYKIKELLRFTPDRIDHSFAELCSPKDQKLTAKGKRSDFKHYLTSENHYPTVRKNRTVERISTGVNSIWRTSIRLVYDEASCVG